MAKYDITYGILRDDSVIATSTICISLTKNDLQEIETRLIERDYSPLLSDLPERIYNRCCTKALHGGNELCESLGVQPNEDMAVAFCEVLPLCIVESLSPETAEKVKAKMKERLPELFENQ